MGGLGASSNLTTPDFDHDESPVPGLFNGGAGWTSDPRHERVRRVN